LKTIKEKQLFRENRRLKALLRVARNDVIALVNELELAEGECLMRYYDFLEAAQNRGGALLNPVSVEIKGTYFDATGNSDRDLHKVYLPHVIAIKGNGKYKRIFLLKPISGKGSKPGVLYRIEVDSNFDDLIKMLDILHLRLQVISKVWTVNVEYFELRNKCLYCILPNFTEPFSKKFKINPDKLASFKEKKNILEHMISFQKIRVRSDFGLPAQSDTIFDI